MPKILVADDNTNIQKMVSLALSERGIDVISVGNGEAAVRRLPELIPDLVLADIFMPVRNGYEVCEYVKKDARFSHIPVILLVGAFDPLDEKEAHRVGADGVLKKPFVPPDPLIAMVTSVLEKNPKLAAELVSAKKVASEAAEHPTASYSKPESQLKAARRVPTEFPEPSPEEAAQVYGFGTGRRTIDPAAVPGDAQAPVSLEEVDEFDGAATSSDWRRSSRNFEIPEETKHKPAFAEDQLSSPVVPPVSHVPPTLTETAEIEPVLAGKPADKIEASKEHLLPVEETAPAEPAVAEAAHAVDAFQESAQGGEPAAEANGDRATPAEQGPEWTMSAKEKEPEPQTLDTPLVKVEHDATITSKAAGWLESIFPAKYPKGGWFSSLKSRETDTEPAEASSSKSEQAESFAIAPAEILEPAPSAETQEFAISTEAHPHAEVESTVEEQPVAENVQAASELPAPEAEPEPTIVAMDEDSFFAEEPETNQAEAGIPEPMLEEVPPTDSEPAVVERVVAAPDNSFDQPWLTEAKTIFADTDPALIEPPAVRVVPEPLLVNEQAHPSASSYGSRAEQLPPVHSFLIPAAQASEATESAAEQPMPSRNHEILRSEEPEQKSERIPTGPLPNREALSEIPFLSPPPEFRQSEAHSADALNTEMVDAVVRKVLERIQPQLQELLSRDLLKPIVENILQNGDRKPDH